MIRKGVVKTGDGMTDAALGIGVEMCVVFADRDETVVTDIAGTLDATVIEAAVGPELEKMRGIVAIIAFRLGGRMKSGLADGTNAVVAFTALAQHFTVVDVGNDVESVDTERRMADFAHVAACHMVLRFADDVGETAVVAPFAVR